MPEIEDKAIISVFEAGLKDSACGRAVCRQGFDIAAAEIPAFIEDPESGTQWRR
jgi:hypothetical protein